MKTPQEAAKELVEKCLVEFMHRTGEIENNRKAAKACALICVEEILKWNDKTGISEYNYKWKDYWQQVKTSIETL